ncbi:MAG: YabP/YqfC family sporulation protein [Clostridia bacterium]|jgi:sporulation protein YqfC|nr:YabP/YqfC family sporulation protein [Clostridia bacterium]MDD3232497.1 YabP/YqfC family sporulation protein [Clostridia bacterium]MDD3862276.1 YabP/YqfC family sporulation protein [Clostridia bacterium]MDD4408503.1 YabP/YqfC family sporulation protein [Clostridia bacterium]
MNIFNYFGELKKELSLPSDIFKSYNLVNISGNLLYVEGHLGLNVISDDNIVFKVKNGIIDVKGKELSLKNLSQTTMAIQGKIYKIEVF